MSETVNHISIGTIFEYKGKTYVCLPSDSCKGCAFNGTRLACNRPKSGEVGYSIYCSEQHRPDNTRIMFKEVNQTVEEL